MVGACGLDFDFQIAAFRLLRVIGWGRLWFAGLNHEGMKKNSWSWLIGEICAEGLGAEKEDAFGTAQ